MPIDVLARPQPLPAIARHKIRFILSPWYYFLSKRQTVECRYNAIRFIAILHRHCDDSDRMCIRLPPHNTHPTPRPHGWAMGLWGLWRKLTALYRTALYVVLNLRLDFNIGNAYDADTYTMKIRIRFYKTVKCWKVHCAEVSSVLPCIWHVLWRLIQAHRWDVIHGKKRN